MLELGVLRESTWPRGRFIYAELVTHGASDQTVLRLDFDKSIPCSCLQFELVAFSDFERSGGGGNGSRFSSMVIDKPTRRITFED